MRLDLTRLWSLFRRTRGPGASRDEGTIPPADKRRRRSRKRGDGPSITTLEEFVVEEVELGGVPEVEKPKARRWPPRWWPAVRLALGWIGLLLVLTAATLFARHAWPVDETRVLAVAWEMWSSKRWFVPTLNGEPLAHAPLLYWLIHLGWLSFEISELAARLVPPLFVAASLALLRPIARRLWPEALEVARYAPFVLLGCFFVAFAAPLLIADTVVMFFTLLAVLALVIMWRGRDSRGWLLFGLALGLALLVRGPLAAIYVLPVALAAPLWAQAPQRPKWRLWYADVGKGVLLAAAVFGLWLVPATLKAGGAFAFSLFRESLSVATLELFPLERPWWWYLPLLLLSSVPWAFLPLPYMRLWRVRAEPLGAGLALCMTWLVLPVAILSVFEVKQPQLLLPVMPAGALFVAWLLFEPRLEGHGENHPLSGLSIPLVLLGVALAVTPKLPRVEFLPSLLWDLSPFVGIGIVLVGVVVAWLPVREVRRRVLDLSAGTVMLSVFLVLGVASQLNEFHRVDEVAEHLASAQAQRRAIAHVGAYEGEFHFAGRLRRPLQVLAPAQAEQWVAWHPDGVIVTYSALWQPGVASAGQPLLERSYRGQQLRVWEVRSLTPPRDAGEPPAPPS